MKPNKLLKYSPSGSIRGFVDTHFSDVVTASPQQQKDYIFGIANTYRDDRKLIFSDESQYLPVSNTPPSPTLPAIVTPDGTVVGASVQALTVPPQEQPNYLVEALFIGIGVVVLLKLFS